MTREKLVFDWGNSETRLIDKVVAFLLVAVFFTVFFSFVDIRVGSSFEKSSQSASVIRFESADLADKWLLIAEEGGPSPGRFEIAGSLPGVNASLDSMSGDPFADGGYEVSLKPLEADSGVSRMKLATKGSRVFPETQSHGREVTALPSDTEVQSESMQPILTPYEKAALEWIPESLPVFRPIEGVDTSSGSPWRFALSLRSDGTISECIALGGGEAGLAEIQEWLLGVKFGAGKDERWLGLRVELINRRQDGSDSR